MDNSTNNKIKYIITNNKTYIIQKQNNSFTTTINIESATKWDDSIKCQAALNILPKAYKNLKFSVKPIEDLKSEVGTNTIKDTNSDESITNVNTVIDKIFG